MIRQEDERFVGCRIPVSDSPQLPRVILGSVKVVQHHGLIADQSRAALDWPGYNAPDIRIALGSSDEEPTALMQGVESSEIQISPVHHIEGAGFGDQDVEYIDVVPFAVGNMDKTRDLTAQIQQRMHLDRALGRAKRRPREQRQTQIDGGRVQCIDGVVQFQAQGFGGVQLPCNSNQRLGELAVQAPVAALVGIGQIAAREVAAQSEVIRFGGMRFETRLDVPQALAKGDLRERHAQELVQATEGRTLKSPRYLATKRRNVCHGANSITWANTSLPAYIQISRENPGSLRFLASVVQVVNTWKSYETPENTGF